MKLYHGSNVQVREPKILEGRYDEQDALKRLMPQKLKNQYVCKTEKAISKLKYEEVIVVDE